MFSCLIGKDGKIVDDVKTVVEAIKHNNHNGTYYDIGLKTGIIIYDLLENFVYDGRIKYPTEWFRHIDWVPQDGYKGFRRVKNLEYKYNLMDNRGEFLWKGESWFNSIDGFTVDAKGRAFSPVTYIYKEQLLRNFLGTDGKLLLQDDNIGGFIWSIGSDEKDYFIVTLPDGSNHRLYKDGKLD